jgi:hypothetical protein
VADVLVKIISRRLIDEIVVGEMLKHQEILVRSRINLGIKVIVTKKLVLVIKSRDEVGAVESCGCLHACSMAQDEAKVKG